MQLFPPWLQVISATPSPVWLFFDPESTGLNYHGIEKINEQA